jgi:exoribonuclease R
MVRDCLRLNDLAKKLRQLRFENGSLTLRDMEIRFGIDEKGMPCRWYIKEPQESNKLIEEYMLLANQVVACKILEHFPESSLLRLHPMPRKDRMNEFQLICKINGITIDTTSSKTLHFSLEKAKTQLPVHK